MPPDRPIRNTAFKPPGRASAAKPYSDKGKSKKQAGAPRRTSDTAATRATASSEAEDDEDEDEDDIGGDDDLASGNAPDDSLEGSEMEDVEALLAGEAQGTSAAKGKSKSKSASSSASKSQTRRTGGKGAAKAGSTAPAQSIPANLLRTLLQQHFRDKSLGVGAEASLLLSKYMDTFVREAIARAAFERAEAAAGGDFLEVEDLEKLAPQLLLDF